MWTAQQHASFVYTWRRFRKRYDYRAVKDKLLTIRLSGEEIERWREEAWRRKLSVAEMVRRCVRKQLSKDLREPRD